MGVCRELLRLRLRDSTADMDTISAIALATTFGAKVMVDEFWFAPGFRAVNEELDAVRGALDRGPDAAFAARLQTDRPHFLRDGKGLAQVVIEDPEQKEQLARLPSETVLRVTGAAVPVAAAPGGVEVHQPAFEVVSVWRQHTSAG